jgi:hypothetical protein
MIVIFRTPLIRLLKSSNLFSIAPGSQHEPLFFSDLFISDAWDSIAQGNPFVIANANAGPRWRDHTIKVNLFDGNMRTTLPSDLWFVLQMI